MTKEKFLYLVKTVEHLGFYYQTDEGIARYGKEIGMAILDKIPPEGPLYSHKVIRSDNPEFKKILRKGLSKINIHNLEEKIDGLKVQLERKKRNQDLIINALNCLLKNKKS